MEGDKNSFDFPQSKRSDTLSKICGALSVILGLLALLSLPLTGFSPLTLICQSIFGLPGVVLGVVSASTGSSKIVGRVGIAVSILSFALLIVVAVYVTLSSLAPRGA
jgi:hypothetical protein